MTKEQIRALVAAFEKVAPEYARKGDQESVRATTTAAWLLERLVQLYELLDPTDRCNDNRVWDFRSDHGHAYLPIGFECSICPILAELKAYEP
jgi:hypothetical protein